MANSFKEFTDREIAIAKSTNLCKLASYLSYRVVRTGTTHTLKEHDSLRIHNQNSWYQWSSGIGGSPIDFLMHFENMKFKDAVNQLLHFNGYHKVYDEGNLVGRNRNMVLAEQILEKNKIEKQEIKKDFILPDKAEGYSRLYAYLMKTRGISKETIDFFVKKKLIYESAERHNIVFLSKDQQGYTKHAFQRGTYDAKPYKGDVAGNDKNYGFNLHNKDSDSVRVFEGAIDLMSYVDIYKKYEDNYLSLGMVSDHPLETYLEEHPHIENIILSLDNDKSGLKAMKELKEKYGMNGYRVDIELPPNQHKDWNEYKKQIMQEVKKTPQINKSYSR